MFVNREYTKCVVITNYRTGSTSFVRQNNKGISTKFEILQPYDNIPTIINKTKTLKKENYICKIMPDHISYNYEHLDIVLEHCDQIVYLYRKDFVEQVKSWIAWNVSEDFGHHYGPMKTYDIDISQKEVEQYEDTIRKNNDFLTECYNKYPGEVFAYEDIQNGKPYNRTNNWITDPIIQPYNTQEMFNEVRV